MYWKRGMETNSGLEMGLNPLTPSFPTVAAVVSDARAEPIVITQCIQLMPAESGQTYSNLDRHI